MNTRKTLKVLRNLLHCKFNTNICCQFPITAGECSFRSWFVSLKLVTDIVLSGPCGNLGLLLPLWGWGGNLQRLHNMLSGGQGVVERSRLHQICELGRDWAQKGDWAFQRTKFTQNQWSYHRKIYDFFFYFILKYNVCRQWGKKCSLYLFCWFHNKSSNKYIWWRGILIPYWSVCVPYLYPDLIEVKFKKVPIFVRGFLSINSMYSKSGKFD